MVKKLADLNFSNSLASQCPFLCYRVASHPLTSPQLLHINFQLLERLELDASVAKNPSFLRFVNGDLEFEGTQFISTAYSGHQFGYYVPRLGDGRALMIGEVQTPTERLELQLKGSGLTPFSRMGDGKAVVRSSIREYLASAHLKALGIPTTEALSVIKGEDDVYRETVEKSAIVLRVAPTFLRFGHFQYLSADTEKLKALTDFTIDHYFNEFKDHPNRYVLFFQDVVKRTAKLFARWQSVGFCHGVLNTDNMSILGLTIDYGPYGFMEVMDLDYICNHSDQEGRYSYGNQPPIGLWNLTQLGIALGSLINEQDRERTLNTYAGIFHQEFMRLLKEKCGLLQSDPEDEILMRELLNMLALTGIDMTIFYRALCRYEMGSLTLSGVNAGDALADWLKLYSDRLKKEELSREERQIRMLQTNPKFILRNYLAQMAIEDHSLMHDLFTVLSSPFEEWPMHEDWAKSTPARYYGLNVSCSS